MADATRSQVVLREVEEKIGELQAVANQRHTDVKGELTYVKNELVAIQDSMTNLSQ